MDAHNTAPLEHLRGVYLCMKAGGETKNYTWEGEGRWEEGGEKGESGQQGRRVMTA